MDDSALSQNASSLPEVKDLDLQTIDKLAIEAALHSQWKEAIDLNKQIINEEPDNIACLNRLGRALFETGQYLESKKVYQKVLELDPYNIIAQKNLKRLAPFKKDGAPISTNSGSNPMISASLLLEEPGITQSVTLIKVAEPQRLLTLSPGMMIKLAPKNRGICVFDHDNHYLGALPDDTSHLLIKLMAGGNEYQALIKSVKSNSITVLIRETFRSKKFKNQPSFISNTSATYSSKHIIMLSDEMPQEEISEESEESDL